MTSYKDRQIAPLTPLFGLGLRSEHYQDCLENHETAEGVVDYVEVHAENFFMHGGASIDVLHQVRECFPISIHATTLGLGSLVDIPETQISKLKILIDSIDPFLVSDHACFAWFKDIRSDELLHAGDLLPIAFDAQTLERTAENIDRVQNTLDRQILLENLSAYIQLPSQPGDMPLDAIEFRKAETTFLVELCRRTGCRLLVDLNNLLVNAFNDGHKNPSEYALAWLGEVPNELIGEIHLAGCTKVSRDQIMVDDHAMPVSEELWGVLRRAKDQLQQVPITVERDNNLPSWENLVAEVAKARKIMERN